MNHGTLHLVSVGPGIADLIPPLAEQTLRESDVIVGYELYLKWIAPWIEGKEIHSPPMTRERERAQKAVDCAREGRSVSLVSSGDIGVYAMASLAFDLMRDDDAFDVKVIPGITAATSCASLLGAPLSHDFATLSLSDLLCPWEWIEHRARHIAQADLAAALYNVQSRERQDSIYKIIDIFLEHKKPGTWCGIVRNAYRPEQATEICTLADLKKRRFDMLTSVIVGNRFTQRKGRFIFTPRGYNDWKQEEETAAHQLQNAVWVFSGTSDGNALAAKIAEAGHGVIISTMSDYGREVALENCKGAQVRSGRMGIEARRRELQKSAARAIVDATHPFAEEMSRQLIALSGELNIPYYRYERPSSNGQFPAIRCESVAQAATEAVRRGKRIFLATGSKDLATFLSTEGAAGCEWFARVTPDPRQIARAIDSGIRRDHLCAMQGPFSRQFNEALWLDWNIDCVITKDSGEAGGYNAKAEAAQAMGIPFLVIEKPRIDYPNLFNEVLPLIQELNGMTKH